MSGRRRQWAFLVLTYGAAIAGGYFAARLDRAGTPTVTSELKQTRALAADQKATATPARQRPAVTPPTTERESVQKPKNAATYECVPSRIHTGSGLIPDPTDSDDTELRHAAFIALEHRDFPGLGSVLRLSADEESMLFDALARYSAGFQVYWNRIAAAPDGESDDEAVRQQHTRNLENEQQLRAILGNERYEHYLTYLERLPEWQQISALRARLDESSTLSDERAQRLVDALYEERDRYVKDLQQAQELVQAKDPQHARTYVPTHVYSLSLEVRSRSFELHERMDPAGWQRFISEQLGESEAFEDRLRQRAAGLLTASQLRRFEELQQQRRVRDRLDAEALRRRRVG